MGPQGGHGGLRVVRGDPAQFSSELGMGVGLRLRLGLHSLVRVRDGGEDGGLGGGGRVHMNLHSTVALDGGCEGLRRGEVKL